MTRSVDDDRAERAALHVPGTSDLSQAHDGVALCCVLRGDLRLGEIVLPLGDLQSAVR